MYNMLENLTIYFGVVCIFKTMKKMKIILWNNEICYVVKKQI